MYLTWPLTLLIHTASHSGQGAKPSQLVLGVMVYPHYLIDILAAGFADILIEESSGQSFISNGAFSCISV